MKLPLATVLLVTAVAAAGRPPAAAGSAASPPFRVEGPEDELAGWIDRFRRWREDLGSQQQRQLEVLLERLRSRGRRSSEARVRGAIAVIDLYAAGVDAGVRLEPDRSAAGRLVQREAQSAFDALVNGETARRLAGGLLIGSDGEHLPRRVAAATLLGDFRLREVRLGLLVAARSSDLALREAACFSLSGWRDESVHALFVQVLTAGSASSESGAMIGAAEAHFRSVQLPNTSRAAPRLAAYVHHDLVAGDWRHASLAVSAASALGDELVVPQLIEALDLWATRAARGQPGMRLQDDIARQLRARSGRSIGRHAQRWRRWWEARQSGRAEPRVGAGAGVPASSASFFGLQPFTNRITFVIDKSGSMSASAGTIAARSTSDGWTRYEEAVEQMLSCLASLGEDTRFNVILFSDGVLSWHSRLTLASTANLRAARAWLLRHGPDGGTQLRRGVERALELDRNGSLDLKKLEADTLVVLCDGETTDGPGWVLPLLRRINALARVVVHAVQIGPAGDATLELLAEETGGDFVRVGR